MCGPVVVWVFCPLQTDRRSSLFSIFVLPCRITLLWGIIWKSPFVFCSRDLLSLAERKESGGLIMFVPLFSSTVFGTGVSAPPLLFAANSIVKLLVSLFSASPVVTAGARSFNVTEIPTSFGWYHMIRFRYRFM